jgi:hypothetical protein
LAKAYTLEENHRHQKAHENALIRRIFYANVVSYYIPLAYSAFDTRNPERFSDMFYLMLSQMVVKQVGFNAFEAIYPQIVFKPKINELKEKFWPVRASYMTQD